MTGTTSVMRPAQPDTPFGISVQWPRTDAQMTLLANTGATIARVGANWYTVENTKGTYNWTDVDAAISACEKHGLKPFLLLMGCPQWASQTPAAADIYGPNTDTMRAGFAAFAAAAAQRYTGRILMWEIWNEVNGGFWYPKPSATDYAALLKATVPAIRAHDSAPIASSGLAGNAGLGNNEPLGWIDQMQALDAIRVTDRFGMHPYTNSGTAIDGMLKMTRDVRVKLDQLGYSYMPISCTECGLSTNTLTQDAQATAFDLTASYLKQLGIDWFCWYQDFDQTDNTSIDANEQHFGVYTLDGTPKTVVSHMQAHAQAANIGGGLVPANQWVYDGTNLKTAATQ